MRVSLIILNGNSVRSVSIRRTSVVGLRSVVCAGRRYRLTWLEPCLTAQPSQGISPNREGEEAPARSRRACWKHGLYSAAQVRAKQNLCRSYSSRVERSSESPSRLALRRSAISARSSASEEELADCESSGGLQQVEIRRFNSRPTRGTSCLGILE